jgi:hypothetical protein
MKEVFYDKNLRRSRQSLKRNLTDMSSNIPISEINGVRTGSVMNFDEQANLNLEGIKIRPGSRINS